MGRGETIAQDFLRFAQGATVELRVGALAKQIALWVQTAVRLLAGPDEEGLARALIEYAQAVDVPNAFRLPTYLLLNCPAILNATQQFEMSAHAIELLLSRPEAKKYGGGTQIIGTVWIAAQEREVAARLDNATIKRAIAAANFLPGDKEMREFVEYLSAYLTE